MPLPDSVPYTWCHAKVPSYAYTPSQLAEGFLTLVEARCACVKVQVMLMPKASDSYLQDMCHQEFLERVEKTTCIFLLDSRQQQQQMGAGASPPHLPKLFRMSQDRKRIVPVTDERAVKEAWRNFQQCETMQHVMTNNWPTAKLKQPYGQHGDPEYDLPPSCSNKSSSSSLQGCLSRLDKVREDLESFAAFHSSTLLVSYKFADSDAGEDANGNLLSSNFKVAASWGSSSMAGRMVLDSVCNVYAGPIYMPVLIPDSVLLRNNGNYLTSLSLEDGNTYRGASSAIRADTIHSEKFYFKQVLKGMVDVWENHTGKQQTLVQMLDGRLFHFNRNHMCIPSRKHEADGWENRHSGGPLPRSLVHGSVVASGMCKCSICNRPASGSRMSSSTMGDNQAEKCERVNGVVKKRTRDAGVPGGCTRDAASSSSSSSRNGSCKSGRVR